MRYLILIAACAALAAACGGGSGGDGGAREAGAVGIAEIASPDGEAMGAVRLTQGDRGVLVQASLRGLAPGPHGFHVHETGACEPDFAAAGGHFAPGGEGHGILSPDGHHAGDLPNIHAAADGTARADFWTSGITLDDGADASIFDADGSAIIVHERADSYGPEPGAGDRVGCGVIRRG